MAAPTLAAVTRAKTTKGEQTKGRILAAALDLFRRVGYEATTMRSVADKAGVSLGNAYYYYKSKEHLLHAFYDEMHQEHAAAVARVLEEEKDLEKRLLGVLRTKFAVIDPYHKFSGLLFRSAADPASPLNPFHEESRHVREAETALYARALEGTRVKIPKDIAAELPELLWTYAMGILLFWIYDDSPDRARTQRMIDHTAHIVVRMIKLVSNPLLRPLRKATLRLLADMRQV